MLPWMEQRTLGRVGRGVGVVGLVAWQLGADWGAVTEADAGDVDDGVFFGCFSDERRSVRHGMLLVGK